MKIVWLKTELLHPVDKGGKIRTYFMLKELKKRHEVVYLTLDDGSAAPDAKEKAVEYCDELITVPFRTTRKLSVGFYRELLLNTASPLPYAIWKYESPAMRTHITDEARDADLMICDFLMSAVNVPDSLGCPAVLFQHNVEAVMWRRHVDVASNPLKRAYLQSQWRKMRAFEQRECRRFPHVVAVSEDDAQVMRDEYGIGHVSVVPTGVDTEFFRPGETATPDPHAMVFTGSMDWLPNDDAMRYFLADVFPAVREQLPDATLTIVGRRPFEALAELAKRTPGVTVTGTVDDVRPYIDKAALFVIPLRIGGGTRLKAYEAMAMEKPVISTAVGVEGLPVEDGRHVVIRDDPRAMAGAIVSLMRDKRSAGQIGLAAAKLVREKFSWEGAVDAFLEGCQGAFEGRVVSE